MYPMAVDPDSLNERSMYIYNFMTFNGDGSSINGPDQMLIEIQSQHKRAGG